MFITKLHVTAEIIDLVLKFVHSENYKIKKSIKFYDLMFTGQNVSENLE